MTSPCRIPKDKSFLSLPISSCFVLLLLFLLHFFSFFVSFINCLSLFVWESLTKIPYTGWLKQQLISWNFCSLGSLRQKVNRFSIWWESISWIIDVTLSSHGGKGKRAPRDSSVRALIPFMRDPPSWLNHPPKASPHNTIILRVIILTWILKEI